MEKHSSVAPILDNDKLLYKLVIQFLIFCQGSHKLLDPHLLQIGKRLKSGATLNDLTPELHAISKTLLHISKQSKQPPSISSPDLNDYIIQRIDEMLNELEVPRRFEQQKAALKQRVNISHDDQSYKKIIDSAIALLLNIKDYSALEQRGIDIFLTDLTEQLGQIEQQAEIVGQSNLQSIDNRNNLNTAIDLLDNIKDFTQQTEDPDSSTNVTYEHLDQLMLQLLEHRQLEDDRQRQAQEQIELMTQKLQALETETDTLRTKLKIEHDRALCDPLTGLPNRMAYKDRLEIEVSRWKRYKTPLTLAIWDIDYFKRINDEYGHKAGDKTLALVGQFLMNNCRETDFVARYGGEEFVMLLPNTHIVQALEMANHIRTMIQQCGFNSNGENIELTLSCGICEFTEDDQDDDVFVRADQALYHAKQAGRNRCAIFNADLQAFNAF